MLKPSTSIRRGSGKSPGGRSPSTVIFRASPRAAPAPSEAPSQRSRRICRQSGTRPPSSAASSTPQASVRLSTTASSPSTRVTPRASRWSVLARSASGRPSEVVAISTGPSKDRVTAGASPVVTMSSAVRGRPSRFSWPRASMRQPPPSTRTRLPAAPSSESGGSATPRADATRLSCSPSKRTVSGSRPPDPPAGGSSSRAASSRQALSPASSIRSAMRPPWTSTSRGRGRPLQMSRRSRRTSTASMCALSPSPGPPAIWSALTRNAPVSDAVTWPTDTRNPWRVAQPLSRASTSPRPPQHHR